VQTGGRNAPKSKASAQTGTNLSIEGSESPSTVVGLAHRTFFEKDGTPRVREITFALVVVAIGYVFQQDNQRGIDSIPKLLFTLLKCFSLSALIISMLSLYKVVSNQEAWRNLWRSLFARLSVATIGIGALIVGAAAYGWSLGFGRGVADADLGQALKLSDSQRLRAVSAATSLYANQIDEAKSDYLKRIKIAESLYSSP